MSKTIKSRATCTPGFSWEYFIFNFTADSLKKLTLGLIVAVLLSINDFLSDCTDPIVYAFNLGGSVLASYLLWSGSAFLGEIIDVKFDWETEGVKKALVLLSVNITYISLIILLITKSIEWVKGGQLPAYIYWQSLVYGVLVTTIVNLVYIAQSIFNFWKNIKFENEQLKKENLRSQLETLKNQVNPHFLFNSLNTLISIIDDDPHTAKQYTQKLSQVYRYILSAREKDTLTLKDELECMEAYNFMLKIRYGENLHFENLIPPLYHHTLIPPLVLQMLIENAIKHNVISASKPLYIHLQTDSNQYLTVKNNLQPKVINVESSKVGLINIMQRYKLLADKQIIIEQNTSEFKVLLPIIYPDNVV